MNFEQEDVSRKGIQTINTLIQAQKADGIIDSAGEVSDGYHTFNELYHHRAMLFATLCSMVGSRAWKSKLHDDGTMYDGMFIVGIDTPKGQATYHYDMEPYWDIFKIHRVLDKAPEFDGHTPEDAINRIYDMFNNM